MWQSFKKLIKSQIFLVLYIIRDNRYIDIDTDKLYIIYRLPIKEKDKLYINRWIIEYNIDEVLIDNILKKKIRISWIK